MTELAFLLDLLLNHKLPLATKKAISERCKEVEQRLTPNNFVGGTVTYTPPPKNNLPPHLANQSPSTIAKLMQHPDLVAQMSQAHVQPVVEPQQPAVIAQTPAAQAAINARQESINLAISGKAEKGRTSPRKF